MMNTELTVNVRPVRHAYFIAEDDLTRFSELARYCCTQWGGINNLIIPVKIDNEADHPVVMIHGWFLDMIGRRRPDIFIDALIPMEADSPLHEALHAYLRSEHFTQPFERWDLFLHTDMTLHPLNIASSQKGPEKPELAVLGFFPGFSTQNLLLEDAILVASFGKIWPGQEKEYEEAYTLEGWDATYPEHMLREQLLADPTASVINLTLKELYSIGTEEVGVPKTYFDIVVAQNVWDLCVFWNLRAISFGHKWLSDRRVLVLSKAQLLQEQGAYLEPLVRLLREGRIHPGIEINVDACFHHYHDEEISQFLLMHPEFELHTGTLHFKAHFPPATDNGEAGRTDEHTSDGTNHRPIVYMENKYGDASLYHEYGGNRSTLSHTFAEGHTSFLVFPHAGPQTLSRNVVYVGLQSTGWNQFPAHPSVAHLIVPGAAFEEVLDSIQLFYQYTLSPGGLSRVSLSLPRTWDLYRAYFHSMGYEVSPSDKKTYADGLLGMAGGLEHEKTHILRSRRAYEILDFLTDKATTKLAREIRKQWGWQQISEEELQRIILASDVLPRFQRAPHTFHTIYSHIKGIPRLEGIDRKDCLHDLAQLVGIKAVQRGMEMKCPSCGTKMWYGIHMLDERVRCSGCLEMFDLPLTESPSDDSDRAFQYALNPLVNQAMDQDILPVVIALLALKTQHAEMYHAVLGMNFQDRAASQRRGDFDFVYIHKHRVYGGECKAGGKLTEKDIRTAKVAQSLGFRAFFFATIRPFEEDGQRLIRDYQHELEETKDDDHPFAVVVLDGPMLFGEQPLPQHIPQ